VYLNTIDYVEVAPRIRKRLWLGMVEVVSHNHQGRQQQEECGKEGIFVGTPIFDQYTGDRVNRLKKHDLHLLECPGKLSGLLLYSIMPRVNLSSRAQLKDATKHLLVTPNALFLLV